jgi:hypothetical protein
MVNHPSTDGGGEQVVCETVRNPQQESPVREFLMRCIVVV